MGKLKELNKLYDELFDSNGDIKLCGREKCMEFINQLDDLKNALNEIDVGNKRTGQINVVGLINIDL